MTTLTTFNKHFAFLNRAPGATWTYSSKRKASHKPLLLLAVLDLVHRGIIPSPFIAVTGDLVELSSRPADQSTDFLGLGDSGLSLFATYSHSPSNRQAAVRVYRAVYFGSRCPR